MTTVKFADFRLLEDWFMTAAVVSIKLRRFSCNLARLKRLKLLFLDICRGFGLNDLHMWAHHV